MVKQFFLGFCASLTLLSLAVPRHLAAGEPAACPAACPATCAATCAENECKGTSDGTACLADVRLKGEFRGFQGELALFAVQSHDSAEKGVPILNKVPYINQLFTNTGSNARLVVIAIPRNQISLIEFADKTDSPQPWQPVRLSAANNCQSGRCGSGPPQTAVYDQAEELPVPFNLEAELQSLFPGPELTATSTICQANCDTNGATNGASNCRVTGQIVAKCGTASGCGTACASSRATQSAHCSNCNCGDSCACGPQQKCVPACACDNPTASLSECPLFAKNGPFKAMVVVTRDGQSNVCRGGNCCPPQAAVTWQYRPGSYAPASTGPPVAYPLPPHVTAGHHHPQPYSPMQLPPPPQVQPPVPPAPRDDDMLEHLVELTVENAVLKAQAEAREEILSQRASFLEELARAKVENAQLEARLEVFAESRDLMENLVEVLVEKARLEGHLQSVEERAELVAELAKERARTPSPTPYANGPQPPMASPWSHSQSENQLLKQRIGQLEAQLKALDGSGTASKNAAPTYPEAVR